MLSILATLSGCSLAALVLITWQLREVPRMVTLLRLELIELRTIVDRRPTPEPSPLKPPSEVFRSGVLEPPPANANPALTILAKKEQASVVATGEMARLVERFKGPKV